MSALLSIAKVITGEKGILVIGAFFDDSGTHATAPVIVIGGLLGTEAQWVRFNKVWRETLAEPAPGKPPLRQFHLAPCRAAEGDFKDYKPVERDFVTRRFREAILGANLVTIAVTVDNNAWKELVTDEIRIELGDAIGLCFYKCVEFVINMVRTNKPGQKVFFGFDQGTQSKLDLWTRLFSAQSEQYPEIGGMAFVKVADSCELQGADLIAVETYQFSQKWMKDPSNPDGHPLFKPF